MDPQEHNAYLSGISPIFAPVSKRPSLTSGTAFDSSNETSPYYASCQSSPFTAPQPSMSDLLCLDSGQNDRKSDSHFLSGGSFLSDTQPHPQSQMNLFKSWEVPPDYYDRLESENVTQPTSSPNSQPPPYQSKTHQSPPKTGYYLAQNGYDSPNPHYWISAQQTPPTWNNIVQQTSTPESTLAHPPRKKARTTTGSRSANDRRYRATHNHNVTENKVMETNHGSTELLFAPELEKALARLYPHCETYDDCMKNLIRDYNAIIGDQTSPNPLLSHPLDVRNTDKTASQEKWRQIESVAIRTKPSPVIVSSEPSDTNPDSDSDGEIENTSYDESESGLEFKSEAMSDNDIDQDLNAINVPSRVAPLQQNTQALSPNPSSVLPSANQQNSNNAAPQRRFACPFHQRNPHKHQKYRACAGPGWEEISRVK
jgi:hypothetical protein